MEATIIENSLADKTILKKIFIKSTSVSGDWTIHEVVVDPSHIADLSKSLASGPWYIHLWKKDDSVITVVYKDKIFVIDKTDRSTWHDAVQYGKSIGIPEEQLDFPVK